MSTLAQLLMGSSRYLAPPGQVLFEGLSGGAAQTYNWIVPAGVYSVSVVCIGGGGVGGSSTQLTGGGGGGLGWRNDIPVTPGEVITVVAGSGGRRSMDAVYNNATYSYFKSVSLVRGGQGGNGGASGGFGGSFTGEGGGNGRAGFSASGGNAGPGGGAGGYPDGGGTDGTVSSPHISSGGRGSSVFGDLVLGNVGSSPGGGVYGGGSGSNLSSVSTFSGGAGAVRIIWPGNERRFPRTRTADE